MRPMMMAGLLCFCVLGCKLSPDAQPIGIEKNEPLLITTPEIVRILEQETIESVSTRHSQTIHIKLKNGLRYRGTYVASDAGKYAHDSNLADILNLVIYIKEHRPPEQTRGWGIMCE